MRFYRSTRIAQNHPQYRGRDAEPLPPVYQVVYGYPKSCACPNRIAIVGEGPGADEDIAGVPFVGKSGEELDRGLDAHSIVPDDCFITNIGRVFKVGNPDPTQEDIETWEELLHEELNTAKPLFIAAVGRISTRYFLGDVDMDAVHGIPYEVVLDWLHNGNGGRVVIIPVVHPAAGFYSTELQAVTAYDFSILGAVVKRKILPRNPEYADQYPTPKYTDLTDEATDLGIITLKLSGGTPADPLPVAIDTEGLPGSPWGLSFSVQPGEAFNIRKVHRLALRIFYNALIKGIREGRLHVVLHNSLHDLRVLRELGIPLPDGSYTDTMVLAYHLCIEPQGLKALAYRHAGMEMDSYDEIVQEAQDKIALEYYELMESLTADGITYATLERTYWEFAVGVRDVKYVAATLELANAEIVVWKTKKVKTFKPKKVMVPASNPVSVGPFKYIEPYSLLVRNADTGQLESKVKKPQQIDFRVRQAMKAYRSGKITAAHLRKRWDSTDDLIVDLVEEVIGEMREASLDDVPLERAAVYAMRDADATRRIYPILKERHWAMGLTRIGKIDHDIIPMVDKMQEVGMPVDVEYFKRLSVDLAERALVVQQFIRDAFDVWINPNSGEQVADLLFSKVEDGGYGLVPTKQTKGTVDKETGEVKGKRGSTVDKVLEGLRDEHPIIPMILEYRGLHKAKTSFCDVAIRKAVLENVGIIDDNGDFTGDYEQQWVVHCNFRITRVSSGRLSATKPNLMAVVGGKLGEEIREGYIAGEGYTFAEWDLNQVEMRVMASEANDAFLISMFMADEDVHTGTADKMFNLNLKRPYNKRQVDKDKHRDPAKRTGFGVITGIQGPGLVDQMRLQGIIVSEDEATQWIVDWLAACPAVSRYMQACISEASQFGYVRDWAGRIRYLPGIHSPFRHIRAEAGRQSHSHKIQAGAQSIMKIAMHTVWVEVIPYWQDKGKFVVPVLQIHDALMLRLKGFNKEEMVELDAQVRAAFFSAAPDGFRIPLDAGSGTATTWGKLEH